MTTVRIPSPLRRYTNGQSKVEGSGATIAELGIGKIVQYYGWDIGFTVIIASAGLSILLLASIWNLHDRRKTAKSRHDGPIARSLEPMGGEELSDDERR